VLAAVFGAVHRIEESEGQAPQTGEGSQKLVRLPDKPENPITLGRCGAVCEWAHEKRFKTA
jgi:hypothetical protein